MQRRVVITAASAITPIGHGREDILRSLREGVSGVKPPGRTISWRPSSIPRSSAPSIIPFLSTSNGSTEDHGPVSYYACQVAKEVLERPAWSRSSSPPPVGVAFGSTHGSPTVQREIYKVFHSRDRAGVSSFGAVDYLKSMVHTTP